MLMLENEDVSFPLLECKSLTITCWASRYSFLGIGTLLKSAPYVENLKILTEEVCNFMDYWHQNTDFLGDNYLSLKKNIFKGSLPNLKIAEIIAPFCSCIDEVDIEELPEFLNSLLEHAIKLEKLVIAPRYEMCNICLTNSEMIEYLLAFPRASKGVVVSSGSVSYGESSLKPLPWFW